MGLLAACFGKQTAAKSRSSVGKNGSAALPGAKKVDTRASLDGVDWPDLVSGLTSGAEGAWWDTVRCSVSLLIEHLGVDHASIFLLAGSGAAPLAISGAPLLGLRIGKLYLPPNTSSAAYNSGASSQASSADRWTGLPVLQPGDADVSALVAALQEQPGPMPIVARSWCPASGGPSQDGKGRALSGPNAGPGPVSGPGAGLQRHLVAVGIPGGKSPVGMLLLSITGPAGSSPPASWRPASLRTIASLLAPHLRPQQVPLARRALAEMACAGTINDLVRALTAAAADVAAAAVRVGLTPRVALIREDASSAAVFCVGTDGGAHSAASACRRRSTELVLVDATAGSAGVPQGAQAGPQGPMPPVQGNGGSNAEFFMSPQPGTSIPGTSNPGTSNPGTSNPGGGGGPGPGSPCRGQALPLPATLLAEALSRGCGAGLCIADCNAYVQETKAYPRDLVLFRGATPPQSLALSAASHEGRPLLALYATYHSVLPQGLLQAVVQELGQLLKALTPAVAALLLPGGPLAAEWAYLHDHLLAPGGVAAAAAAAAAANGSNGRPRPSNPGRGDVSINCGAGGGRTTADGTGGDGDPVMTAMAAAAAALATGAAGVCGTTGTGGSSDRDSQRLAAFVAGGVVIPTANGKQPSSVTPTARDTGIVVGRSSTAGGGGAAASTVASAAAATGGLVSAAGGFTSAGGVPTGRTSFSLEAAGSPRGGLRLAPLITSLHDRLKTAQAEQLTSRAASRLQDLESLRFMEKIGKGGYGSVYRGLYHGAEVAIKVVEDPASGLSALSSSLTPEGGGPAAAVPPEQAAKLNSKHLHDAIELVASVSMSHPNIVQLITYFVDVRAQQPKAPTSATDKTGTNGNGNGNGPNGTTRTGASREARAGAGREMAQLGSPYDTLYGTAYKTLHHTAGSMYESPYGNLYGGPSEAYQLAQVDPYSLLACGTGDDVMLDEHGRPVDEHHHDEDEQDESDQYPEPLIQLVHMGSSGLDASGRSNSFLAGAAAGNEAIVLVMEFCDRGSLKEAIEEGDLLLVRGDEAAAALAALGDGGGGGAGGAAVVPPPVDMKAVYSTLLEVALALRHMHGLHMVHCDLKPQNVLLKSSPRDPRGFTAKLSDFGLAKMMATDEGGQLVIRDGIQSGTITHLPPEALQGRRTLSSAVDIYSFAIVMFQMLAGMAVYPKGMEVKTMIRGVVKHKLRPTFPAWVPKEYRDLAQRCWADAPEARPSALQLVAELEALLAASDCSHRFGGARRGRKPPHRCATETAIQAGNRRPGGGPTGPGAAGPMGRGGPGGGVRPPARQWSYYLYQPKGAAGLYQPSGGGVSGLAGGVGGGARGPGMSGARQGGPTSALRSPLVHGGGLAATTKGFPTANTAAVLERLRSANAPPPPPPPSSMNGAAGPPPPPGSVAGAFFLTAPPAQIPSALTAQRSLPPGHPLGGGGGIASTLTPQRSLPPQQQQQQQRQPSPKRALLQAGGPTAPSAAPAPAAAAQRAPPAAASPSMTPQGPSAEASPAAAAAPPAQDAAPASGRPAAGVGSSSLRQKASASATATATAAAGVDAEAGAGAEAEAGLAEAASLSPLTFADLRALAQRQAPPPPHAFASGIAPLPLTLHHQAHVHQAQAHQAHVPLHQMLLTSAEQHHSAGVHGSCAGLYARAALPLASASAAAASVATAAAGTAPAAAAAPAGPCRPHGRITAVLGDAPNGAAGPGADAHVSAGLARSAEEPGPHGGGGIVVAAAAADGGGGASTSAPASTSASSAPRAVVDPASRWPVSYR